MQVAEAIRVRKTIRAFKSDRVPKEIISSILETAVRAPSGANSQPWEFTVLSGNTLENLKDQLLEQFELRVEPYPDFPSPSFTGVYKQRQVEVAISLFKLLGIKREDREKRKQWTMQMLKAFGAPCLILLCIDEKAASNFTAILGLGAVMQNICLAALEFNMGTALLAAWTEYPGTIKDIAGIPASKKLAIAIAIGYPDWEARPNKLVSAREPAENLTRWIGMEDAGKPGPAAI